MTPRCSSCGSAMRKRSKSEDDWGGCLVVVILLLIGCGLSCVGLWFVGLPLALIGLAVFPFVALKARKFWRCPRCGLVVDRM